MHTLARGGIHLIRHRYAFREINFDNVSNAHLSKEIFPILCRATLINKNVQNRVLLKNRRHRPVVSETDASTSFGKFTQFWPQFVLINPQGSSPFYAHQFPSD